MRKIDAVVTAATRKLEVYREENNGEDPPPSAVFLMHPDTLTEIRRESTDVAYPGAHRPQAQLLGIPVEEKRFIEPGEVELAPRQLREGRP